MSVRSVRIALAVFLIFTAGVLPGAAGSAPGDLDPSFGGDGIVTTDFGTGGHAYALAILPNGKIVAAGGSAGDFALARYLPDGSLDPVLDGDGKVTTDFGSSVGGVSGLAIQPNGRIVAVGGVDTGRGFVLARYKRDGGLDPTFDGDGKVVTNLGGVGEGERGADVVIQPDGKIIAAGTRDTNDDAPGIEGDYAVVRYNPDGTLDASFGSGGVVLTALFGEAFAVLLQDDGKIVVAGDVFILEDDFDFDLALVRYMPDGSLDPSFGGDGIVIADLAPGANDAAIDAVLQADGKIVVAGIADQDPGDERAFDFLLARFGVDGSLDTQPLDPYLDAPFGLGGQVTTGFGGFDDFALAVAIESGGKLVAAGTTYLDPTRSESNLALARYKLDGGLDETFGAGGKVTTDISSLDVIEDVAIQSDGSIVVAGSTSGQFTVARYLAAPCCGVPGGIPSP